MEERVQRFNKGSYEIVASTKEEGSYMEKLYKKNLRSSSIYKGLRAMNVALEITWVLWCVWYIIESFSSLLMDITLTGDRVNFLLLNIMTPVLLFVVCVKLEDELQDKADICQANVDKALGIMTLKKWLEGTDITSCSLTVRDETFNSRLSTVTVGFTRPDTKERLDILLNCIIDSEVSSPILDLCKGTIKLNHITPCTMEADNGESIKK